VAVRKAVLTKVQYSVEFGETMDTLFGRLLQRHEAVQQSGWGLMAPPPGQRRVPNQMTLNESDRCGYEVSLARDGSADSPVGSHAGLV